MVDVLQYRAGGQGIRSEIKEANHQLFLNFLILPPPPLLYNPLFSLFHCSIHYSYVHVTKFIVLWIYNLFTL